MKKVLTSPVIVNEAHGMRRYGQVLSLKHFRGPIELFENKFINNQVKFNTCDISSSIQSSTDSIFTK